MNLQHESSFLSESLLDIVSAAVSTSRSLWLGRYWSVAHCFSSSECAAKLFSLLCTKIGKKT